MMVHLYHHEAIESGETMPKTVDHAERRHRIIEGLLRVVNRDGLHAASMRSVAAEADVSLRLVQYYFGTKAELLAATLRQLDEDSNRRWQARLAALPDPTARAFLEAFFEEALPTDDQSRSFHAVFLAFTVLSLTDPDLAQQRLDDGPDRLEARIGVALEEAARLSELRIGLDPRLEAARAVTLSHGLGTSVLIGQRSVSAARVIYQAHLTELFGPADRPAD